jgi:4-aminobutyrate aminotransferase-like enzyme
LETGEYLKSAFERLQDAWPLVGDVRGRGLFLGIELVDSRETRTPAAAQAKALVNRMKDKGVLLSTDGPDYNVIKLKPPLSFGIAEADLLLGHLRDVLAEDALQSTTAS